MSIRNPHPDTEKTNFPALIVEHYEDPHQRGPCPGVSHAAEAQSKCGSIVRVELRIADEELEAFWFDGEGCIASQAAASILAEMAADLSLEELNEVDSEQLLAPFAGTLPEDQRDCAELALRVLRDALEAPIDSEFDDGDRPTFGGPDLGDEC